MKPQTIPEAGVRLPALLEACLTQQELLDTALTHETLRHSGLTKAKSPESSLVERLRLPFQGERQWPVEKPH